MDIVYIARLANLPLKSSVKKKLQQQFKQTLEYVAKINKLNTDGVPPVSQIIRQVNIMRPDVINQSRILSSNQALSGANRTHKGYFVVPSIFDAN